MNPEMLKTGYRSAILFFAGMVGGWGVSKGWYSEAGLTAFLNSELFASIVAAVVTGTFGVIAKTKLNLLIAGAKANPEVTVVDPTGVIAAATPNSPNIVAAGTVAATTAAKVVP